MLISKSLLILGHPRSGKTTLGDMICDKFGFSFISIDSLVYAFREILPELEMHHEPERSEIIFAPFLFTYMDRIKHASVYRNFVIDSCHVRPKIAEKMMDKDKYKLAVLGCPSLAPEQYVAAIRKNDKSFDWTAKQADNELLSMAKQYISTAKQMESECAGLGIKFIDTSFDRQIKLEKFVENLEDFLTR
ncbi:MAG: hypothetical protein LBB08_01865 [Rickettsiales bacterium]|jgi:hypothetical protein|nr:hypothetical protein [Rickettsiales bacterium]